MANLDKTPRDTLHFLNNLHFEFKALISGCPLLIFNQEKKQAQSRNNFFKFKLKYSSRQQSLQEFLIQDLSQKKNSFTADADNIDSVEHFKN